MIAEGTAIGTENWQDDNHAIGAFKADRSGVSKGLVSKSGTPLKDGDPLGHTTLVSPMWIKMRIKG